MLSTGWSLDDRTQPGHARESHVAAFCAHTGLGCATHNQTRLRARLDDSAALWGVRNTSVSASAVRCLQFFGAAAPRRGKLSSARTQSDKVDTAGWAPVPFSAYLENEPFPRRRIRISLFPIRQILAQTTWTSGARQIGMAATTRLATDGLIPNNAGDDFHEPAFHRP